MRTILVLLALGVTIAAAAAAPPETSFLTPARHAARVGERVSVQFSTATDARLQPAAWPAPAKWLLLRGPTTQENRHDVQPAAGETAITVQPQEPGLTLIGMDLEPVTTQLTGAELRDFAARNVAEKATGRAEFPAADTAVPVRVVRSTKTLIRVTGERDADASVTAVGKTGQHSEIQPLVDPTRAAVGSDVPLRVFIAGDKKTGVKVQVTSPGGQTTSFVTDSVGSGHFRVTEAGVWRVEGHHLVAPAGDNKEWTLYTATLTFENTAKGGVQ